MPETTVVELFGTLNGVKFEPVTVLVKPLLTVAGE